MNVTETSPSKTLNNFAYSGACKVVAALSGFAVSVVTARSLGAQEMGTYSFAIWVAGAIAALSALGLPDSVAKFVAEYKGAGKHSLAAGIARKIVTTQFVVAGLAALIGGGAWALLTRHHLIVVFLALATVLPAALQQILLALLEGALRFDLQLLATFGGALFQLGIVAAFAMGHAKIEGFLVANLVSALAITVLTLFLCRPLLESSSSAEQEQSVKKLSGRIFSFSISIYALSLLSMIVFDKSELFFLKVFRSPEELAYYSIAFGLTARLATAGDSISYVLFPMFVTRYAQHGSSALGVVYKQSIRYVQLLMVPAFVWCLPIAPRLVILAYGSEYANVASVVQVLLGTMLVTIMLTVSASVIFALEKQRLFLRSMLVVAGVNLILDVALIPRFGALGAALANGLSQVLAVCCLTWLLQKELPESFPFVASVKIYFAAAVSATPIFCTELIHKTGFVALSLSVALAAAVYIFLLGSLREINRSEVLSLRDGVIARLFRKVG
jgi:O-antigen/teichoic acid export membrane protein